MKVKTINLEDIILEHNPHLKEEDLFTNNFNNSEVKFLMKEAIKEALKLAADNAEIDYGPNEIPNPQVDRNSITSVIYFVQ